MNFVNDKVDNVSIKRRSSLLGLEWVPSKHNQKAASTPQKSPVNALAVANVRLGRRMRRTLPQASTNLDQVSHKNRKQNLPLGARAPSKFKSKTGHQVTMRAIQKKRIGRQKHLNSRQGRTINNFLSSRKATLAKEVRKLRVHTVTNKVQALQTVEGDKKPVVQNSSPNYQPSSSKVPLLLELNAEVQKKSAENDDNFAMQYNKEINNGNNDHSNALRKQITETTDSDDDEYDEEETITAEELAEHINDRNATITKALVSKGISVDLTEELGHLKLFQPALTYMCIDSRGVNLRSKPVPNSIAPDGSGASVGETFKIVAQTKNWIKLDSKVHCMGDEERWAPLRLYWGDEKILFKRVVKVSSNSSCCENTVTVILSVEEFNKINFRPSTEKNAIGYCIDSFIDRDTHDVKSKMIVQSGHCLAAGMDMLAIGPWQFESSNSTVVAAMLNCRADVDEVLFEVSHTNTTNLISLCVFKMINEIFFKTTTF